MSLPAHNEPSKTTAKEKSKEKLTIIKNAFANVARGSASALVALMMPPFLTRILSQESYSTWLLILQLSTYVSLLDFGIQTAVGRFVAHTTETNDFKKRDTIVSTSIVILIALGILAIFLLAFLSLKIPLIFVDMPSSLVNESRVALILVGGSLVANLPLSALNGTFIGLQRYDIPAWTTGASRLLGGFLTILVAYHTKSIALMGLATGISIMAGGLGQLFMFKNLCQNIKIQISNISAKVFHEIVSYSFGLSIWTLGMFLVSGLDIAIVGYFDYKNVAYYTLAVTLTNFVVQLQGSIFSVLLPSATILNAREDKIGLGDLLLKSTRYGVITLVLSGSILVIGGQWILLLWVGKEYAKFTITILQVLVIANAIRLSGLPYATLVIAAGQQKYILVSPLIEGIANFLSSVVFTNKLGAIGAAIGTVIGGIISITFHFLYNLKRTTSIYVSHKVLLKNSLLKPFACGIPSLIFFAVSLTYPLYDTVYYIIAAIISFTLTLISIWIFSVNSHERKVIKLVFKKYTHLFVLFVRRD